MNVADLVKRAIALADRKMQKDESSDDEQGSLPVVRPLPKSKSTTIKVQSEKHLRLSSSLDSFDNLQPPPVNHDKGMKSCEELAAPQKGVRAGKKERRKEREKTKTGWFNMRPSDLTEENKNDLTVLQMRSVLDPKRFYKGPDVRGALPKFFQVGKIIESAADFYSGRVPKKQRKKTLVDELMEDAEFRKYNKRKYDEVQTKQPQSRSYKRTKMMKRQKKT